MHETDDEVLVAAVDLVGRTGARHIIIGHLHEDPGAGDWYASAEYGAAGVATEGHRGPAEAAEALARRLLEGGKCVTCEGVIALAPDGRVAYYDGALVDGSPWPVEHVRTLKVCQWRRTGRRWQSACEQAGEQSET